MAMKQKANMAFREQKLRVGVKYENKVQFATVSKMVYNQHRQDFRNFEHHPRPEKRII